METILVTGANGYLANYVYHENKDEFKWIKMTRKDADFSNPSAVRKFIEKQDFDICFHCAANASTAICEDNPQLANKINVESTKVIVDICKEKNARLIFCSSEQVFNGKENPGPFKETELPIAVSVYGQNKIDCEKYIRSQEIDAIILRFSWMMGLSFDNIKASASIVKNVMNALIKQEPTLFTCNEKRGMTYAKYFAKQFKAISKLPSDTYHVCCQNEFTTYQAACYIAKQLGCKQETIEQIILPNYKRYQDRFRDFRLDASKLASYGITFGTFNENIDELLRDFNWKNDERR
ncbi:MAG: sugar nucleotide-binding protein [[Clostridium] spiroforme]|uniref:dTDP-4-dehydrorhamnose reductase n=1 Tax=Thomasclavelia spiroformis TaxID=29348 RepID=A0A943EP89_9FIRM|nr:MULTISPECIES: sugar nucleotide-binding protein [Thomasclavelia]MBS5588020.1 sugar nucleotide-binding protein [Thomasclavelia spiroformis]